MKIKPWQLIVGLIVYTIVFSLLTLFFLSSEGFASWRQYEITPRDIISAIGVVLSFVAILVVFSNTNKQIQNQNKESHRPYISIFSLNDITAQDSKEYEEKYNPYYKIKTYSILENKILDKSNSKIIFTIKNMGYGVARDIRIYSLDHESNSLSRKFIQTEKVASVTTLDIINGKSKKILFDIYYHCRKLKQIDSIKDGMVKYIFDYESRDYCNFVLFYGDLSDNVYSTVISLSFNCHGPFQYGYYTEDTTGFDKLLKDLPVDYKELKRKYLNRKREI